MSVNTNEYEVRIDKVNRENIWQPVVEAWLESFKSEETPIEKRITDYRLNGYGTNINTDEKIQMNFMFEVTPVNSDNTEWDTPQRNIGYIEMINVDGVFQTEYLSNFPKNYDKFLEEFEVWKKENENVETLTVQGEKEILNSNKEIEQMSDGIVAVCTIIIVITISTLVINFLKNKFPKLKK